ncbi:DNA polymerase III, chi subunit [Poseidonocella pacifica]|uniref:DNA polymerase III, chi subunit n=1 Tax=Poseidonocella pacifica TaxID=871651 RepID=A0A1I0VAT2_9RHOB|nr:DNA polymerase III subunit chi [Poseidonocella pacifica]SFA73352.1 DNA polymerase III, chi subunit [Poseidonocella pacifica]
MGAAYFYHLTRHPLEVTLPLLIGKSLAAGWRVAVRGTDENRLRTLDEKLWLGSDSFLPHGMAGGEFDSDQPVLLTRDDARNSAQCWMMIDGATASPDEVTAAERVCILFDGNDDVAMQRAREQWRTLTGAGCAAQYWSEESGRWEKKRDTAA